MTVEVEGGAPVPAGVFLLGSGLAWLAGTRTSYKK
jgi:hypothetical protein